MIVINVNNVFYVINVIYAIYVNYTLIISNSNAFNYIDLV